MLAPLNLRCTCQCPSSGWRTVLPCIQYDIFAPGHQFLVLHKPDGCTLIRGTSRCKSLVKTLETVGVGHFFLARVPASIISASRLESRPEKLLGVPLNRGLVTEFKKIEIFAVLLHIQSEIGPVRRRSRPFSKGGMM